MNRARKMGGKRKRNKAKSKKQLDEIQDEMSDGQMNDPDMMNNDLVTQKDADHISLNTEEREEIITKALNSNDP